MTATGTGDKPPPRGLTLTSFKPFVRGALRGYCNVTWAAAGLRFTDISVFASGDKTWVMLPAAPVLDSEGKHLVADGKRQYRALLEWRDRERATAFSKAVIELLLRKFPDALDAPTQRSARSRPMPQAELGI